MNSKEFHNHRENILGLLSTINELNFEKCALEIFHFQKKYNQVYAEFCELSGVSSIINSLDQIPFLPISAFKHRDVVTGSWEEEKTFMSSGTSDIRSKHRIRDLKAYQKQSTRAFFEYVGSREIDLICLLSSYQENPSSSLLAMIDGISAQCNFLGYFRSPEEDAEIIRSLIEESKNPVLFGVSFALLDLAHKLKSDLMIQVFCTGGMKGRRNEISNRSLFKQFRNAWPNSLLHTEYGMTELLSQFYGRERELHQNVASKVFVQKLNDPFGEFIENQRGRICIMDLYNFDSCSFIKTDDLGIRLNEKFEILGRIDNSELRGCSQMYGSV